MPEPKPTSPAERRRIRWALLWGWLCAAAVMCILGWLGRGVVLRHDFGFDRAVREGVHERGSPALTGLMVAASLGASPACLAAVGAVAVGWLFWRRRVHAANLVIVTMFGALLLSACLKVALPRMRPEPWYGVPLPRSGSFPSGHALVAMSFFGGLSAVLSRRTRRAPVRALLWTGAAAAVLLVGLSRVYLGVHYPSDVLAGYGVGLLWVATVAATDRYSRRAVPAPS
jgi:membrane-associated phospholipid phosphatase